MRELKGRNRLCDLPLDTLPPHPNVCPGENIYFMLFNDGSLLASPGKKILSDLLNKQTTTKTKEANSHTVTLLCQVLPSIQFNYSITTFNLLTVQRKRNEVKNSDIIWGVCRGRERVCFFFK